MLKMVEMDENVTLAAQLEEQKDSMRSVILINKFNVKPEDVDQLLRAWAADAAYLKQKPRVHFYAASSRHWRKLCVYQLRSMGVCRAL